MRKYNSTINNVFSVQLGLACREIVSNFWIAFFSYFPLVISVFFCCCFRITRRFMLRRKNELNICQANINFQSLFLLISFRIFPVSRFVPIASRSDQLKARYSFCSFYSSLKSRTMLSLSCFPCFNASLRRVSRTIIFVTQLFVWCNIPSPSGMLHFICKVSITSPSDMLLFIIRSFISIQTT